MASWKEGIEYLIKKEVLSTVLGDSNNESTLDQANDLLVILREQEKSTQPYAGNSPQVTFLFSCLGPARVLNVYSFTILASLATRNYQLDAGNR